MPLQFTPAPIPFLNDPQAPLGSADVVILPVSCDMTTTFQQGTDHGPEAVVRVSEMLESWDDETRTNPCIALKVHTHRIVSPAEGSTIDTFIPAVERHLHDTIATTQFVIGIGGEHSITPPLAKFAMGNTPGTIVQIDGHCDLRDEYFGTRNNHACAMRRLVDVGHRIISIGPGMLAEEERRFVDANPEKISLHRSWDLAKPGAFDRVVDELSALSGPVYLTIDVDGLDTGIAPGTGTQLPGGLSYHQALAVIRNVMGNPNTTVRGADVVEVAPLPDSPLTEFTAALLIFRILGDFLQRRG